MTFSKDTESWEREHGIPLPRLLIFGKTGQREVKDWIKEWLKR